jgi:hypothetical protein
MLFAQKESVIPKHTDTGKAQPDKEWIRCLSLDIRTKNIPQLKLRDIYIHLKKLLTKS